MTTFLLIPGAGGVAWYWHRVTRLLEAAGHAAIAVDLPGDDPKAGVEAYADLVRAQIGDRRDIVLVAQSIGGMTAPLVCERAKVDQLVFVNAMIPLPGERVGDWGDATGSAQARLEAARAGGWSEEFGDEVYYLHDIPPDLAKEGAKHERDETMTIFEDTCRFTAFPDIPIHVIVGADDRLFPVEFQRRVARERLGVEADVLRGGHLIALSNPRGLSERLISYLSR